MLVSIAVVALLGLVAVGATCRGDEAAQSPQLFPTEQYPGDWRTEPRFFPTPGSTLTWESVLGGVADSVEEAASFAREKLYSPPPLYLIELDSMTYVVASVGEARALFDPDGRDFPHWDTSADTPAVIFVAYGSFQVLPPVAVKITPAPPFSTVWVVVPLGVEGTRWVATDEQYDLSVFGEVGELDVPLPRFPTPVDFRTKVDGP
jgi:hypothetical protein